MKFIPNKSLIIKYLPQTIFFVIVEIVVILLSLGVGYLAASKSIQNKKIIVKEELMVTPGPAASATPAPAYTPIPTVDPNAGRIALHIDSIDWSSGHAAGLLSDVTVRLYNMDGTFIEEKTPTAYIQNGNIGTGGDTVFYVLPSTYKLTSEDSNKTGTCTVTVRSTTEYNSCAIYLVNK